MSEEELVRQAYIKGYNDCLKLLQKEIDVLLGYERYEMSGSPQNTRWQSSRYGQPFKFLLEEIKSESL